MAEKALSRHPRPPRDCEVCGVTYRINYRQQRTCGRRCGVILRGQVPGGRIPPSLTPASVRRRKAERRAAKAAAGTRGKRMWTQGACAWCGEQFTSTGPAGRPVKFCSRKCGRRAAKRRRLATLHGGTGWRWSDFMRMARTFNYCCAYCGTKPERLDPDHVVPLARGGTDAVSNLLPACTPCNSDKRDLLLTEWAADRQRRGLDQRTTQCVGQRYHHLALPPARQRAA